MSVCKNRAFELPFRELSQFVNGQLAEPVRASDVIGQRRKRPLNMTSFLIDTVLLMPQRPPPHMALLQKTSIAMPLPC